MVTPANLGPSASCSCLALALWCKPQSAAAQDVLRGPGPTLICARHATRPSRALFAGYGKGSWFGFLALIQNPRPLEAAGSLQWSLDSLTLSSGLSKTVGLGTTYIYLGKGRCRRSPSARSAPPGVGAQWYRRIGFHA